MQADYALAATLLAGVAIVIGILGTIIPILPGSLLIGGAVLIWALLVQTSTAWVTMGIVLVIVVIGNVANYLTAGRRISATGVPRTTLVLAGIGGLVGFFVIPLLGLPIGIVIGMFLAENARMGKSGAGRQAAWRSTVATLKALGLGMLIEASAAAVAGTIWFASVLFFHALG